MSAPIFVVRLMPNFDASYQGPTSVDRVEWAVFQDGEQKGPIGEGTLSVIGKAFEAINNSATRIVVLTPAEHSVLTRVKIPLNQKRHRGRLISYVLEESLNQSVDEIFFAHEWLDETQDVGVAYTNRLLLERTLDVMAAQGLAVDALYPEHYLLPHQPGQVFAIFGADKVLMRKDNWSALCVPKAMSPFVIERLVREVAEESLAAQNVSTEDEDALPELASTDIRVQLIFNGEDPEQLALSKRCEETINALQLPVQVSVKRMFLKQNLTQVLASEAARLVMEHHSFQMLQGEFKAFKRKRDSRYPYKATAALVAAVGLFQLVYLATDYSIHKAALTELRQDNLQTFKAAFPQVRRVRGSLQRALDRQLAVGSQNNADSEFLVLLNTVGPSLRKAQGLNIQRLSYDGDQAALRVDLSVKNFPDLEAIQQSIESNALSVKIDGANKEKAGVKARLRIQRDV